MQDRFAVNFVTLNSYEQLYGTQGAGAELTNQKSLNKTSLKVIFTF